MTLKLKFKMCKSLTPATISHWWKPFHPWPFFQIHRWWKPFHPWPPMSELAAQSGKGPFPEICHCSHRRKPYIIEIKGWDWNHGHSREEICLSPCRLWSNWGVHWQTLCQELLLQPRQAHPADSSVQCQWHSQWSWFYSVTEVISLILHYKNHSERTTFAVCGLDKQKLILGHPWLWKHNPEIDWVTQEVKMSRCPPQSCPGCRDKAHQERAAQKVLQFSFPYSFSHTTDTHFTYLCLSSPWYLFYPAQYLCCLSLSLDTCFFYMQHFSLKLVSTIYTATINYLCEPLQ